MTKSVVPLELLKTVLPQPLVITLGNLKGGAAKTTSSFFLACYFAIDLGLRVLVIDADPLSQTGDSWNQRLKEGNVEVPFDLITFPSRKIGRPIEQNSPNYDVIIVDAGGESADIFKAAVEWTHELVMMTSANPSEYNRIPGTFEAAQEAAAKVTHDINVRVLMAKVPVTKRGDKNVSTEYLSARHFLEDAGYEVFQNYASNWQWYRQAADGLVGAGAENPINDRGEYLAIGDELLKPYIDPETEEDDEQGPGVEPVGSEADYNDEEVSA